MVAGERFEPNKGGLLHLKSPHAPSRSDSCPLTLSRYYQEYIICKMFRDLVLRWRLPRELVRPHNLTSTVGLSRLIFRVRSGAPS